MADNNFIPNGKPTLTQPSAPGKLGDNELNRPCQLQADAGPEMVLIAEGSYKMGSPDSEVVRNNDESPPHDVSIPKPFALSRCEVTVGEFARFVAATGYPTDAETNGKGCYIWDNKDKKSVLKQGIYWRNPGFDQQDNHPVVCISLNDAQHYIEWLNTYLNVTSKPYRLPSEAEWEYAARAGTASPYYWGAASQCGYANGADLTLKASQQFPDYWQYADCPDKFAYTAPVGSFKPNAWGLYDMSGNVWEWVEDCWHDTYRGAPTDGSAWQDKPGKCDLQSVRGGGWNYIPTDLRSAFRFWLAPDETYDSQGFRLARTL